MQVWALINDSLKAGNACALISVVATKGSTPREVGARIVANVKGGFQGTIGGGNLEHNCIHFALNMLGDDAQNFHLEKHLLGPDMGQCCGGAVTVLIEKFNPKMQSQVQNFADAEAKGKFLARVLLADNAITREFTDGDTEQLGLTGTNQIIEEFGQPNLPIYLFGAGHVGRALMLNLAVLPFDVTWVDSRKSEFPSAVPANFKKIYLDKPHEILATAPSEAQIIILTHDHDVDFDIAFTALAMNRFDYVGMIGSKTKKARFKSRFKAAGLDKPLADKLNTPLGIAGISSKKPSAIAISIVAEILSRIEI